MKHNTNKIYSITAIADLKLRAGTNIRCFGWAKTLSKAKKWVEENRCEMHECYYNYIVVEEMMEGIHPICAKECWYKWHDRKRKFMPVSKPENTKGTINWGIG